MAATMKDIAKEAGVSVTTVSKIFNERDMNISEATKKRVREIAEKLNFVPNSVAKSLRTKNSYLIGVIIDDISDPFYSLYMRGIAETAVKNNFGVLFCSANGNIFETEEESYDGQIDAAKFLAARMVDGIIIDKVASTSNLKSIISSKFPVIAYAKANTGEKLNIGQVYIDTKAAIHEATTLLIDKGCKNIAFISSNNEHYEDRLIGFQNALDEKGVEQKKELIYMRDFDISTGQSGFEAVWKYGVDGVVCGNDQIAIGVLDEAKKRGIKVPDEIRVIGLDDIWMAKYTTPSLTTIHQPIYEQGVEATQMLIDNIIKKIPLFKKELKYHIVMRESV